MLDWLAFLATGKVSPENGGTAIQAGVRKCLVIVNPVSGTKKGMEMFNELKADVLDRSNMTADVVVTTHSAHATEYIAQLDAATLDSYYAIVCVGGDGILYEVLTGIHQRADKDHVLQTARIAILPAGTGNGLAKSLTDQKYEACDVKSVGHLLAKGYESQGKLMRLQVKQSDGTVQERTSFLSLTWGVISDIDLDSEVFRWMGAARFDVYGLYRTLNMKTYSCKLMYCERFSPPRVLPDINLDVNTNGGDWKEFVVDKFISVIVLVVPWISMSTKLTNCLPLDSNYLKLIVIKRYLSKWRQIRSMLAFDSISSVERNRDTVVIDCDAFRILPKGVPNTYMNVDGEKIHYGDIQGQIVRNAINYCA